MELTRRGHHVQAMSLAVRLGGRPNARERPGTRILPILGAADLGLTEAQEAEIRSLLQEQCPVAHLQRQAERASTEALMDALLDPATPESRLRRLHANLSQLRCDELLRRRALMNAVSSVLTEPQRIAVEELHRRWRGPETPRRRPSRSR